MAEAQRDLTRSLLSVIFIVVLIGIIDLDPAAISGGCCLGGNHRGSDLAPDDRASEATVE